MTLLAEVVGASREVVGTSSRSRKVAILAELLRRLDADEVPIAVGLLSGVPRQGRVGVGYSTIYGVDHARAVEPILTVGDLDRALVVVSETSGRSSTWTCPRFWRLMQLRPALRRQKPEDEAHDYGRDAELHLALPRRESNRDAIEHAGLHGPAEQLRHVRLPLQRGQRRFAA